MTAPPLQPVELVPLPEIEEGPVWWVWDAEFTLQRIGTQRAKVILPFEPAPPQYLSKPPQNFAEYSLPMLFWVQGQGQYFDKPPSFLREMTRLARRAGVAVVILEEENIIFNEPPSMRATRLIESIRLTEGDATSAILTIQRSGITAKLRRVGRASVGGWSRGGEAALLACGPAAQRLPPSARPKRFIALAPSSLEIGKEGSKLNLSGITGLLVFSAADRDVDDRAFSVVMRSNAQFLGIRYWCVSHNGFMDAQVDPNTQGRPSPWGGAASPPCFLFAFSSTEHARRKLFSEWGALAAIFADSSDAAAALRSQVMTNGVRGLKIGLCDVVAVAGKPAKVVSTSVLEGARPIPPIRGRSINWRRDSLSSIARLPRSIFHRPGTSSPPIITFDGLGTPDSTRDFAQVDDGGLGVVMLALAGRAYTVKWTVEIPDSSAFVNIRVATFTRPSFANAGVAGDGIFDALADGALMLIPKEGSDPAFTVGLLRLRVYDEGGIYHRSAGTEVGEWSAFWSNPVFASEAYMEIPPVYNDILPFPLGAYASLSPVLKGRGRVVVEALFRVRNTSIVTVSDPRFA